MEIPVFFKLKSFLRDPGEGFQQLIIPQRKSLDRALDQDAVAPDAKRGAAHFPALMDEIAAGRRRETDGRGSGRIGPEQGNLAGTDPFTLNGQATEMAVEKTGEPSQRQTGRESRAGSGEGVGEFIHPVEDSAAAGGAPHQRQSLFQQGAREVFRGLPPAQRDGRPGPAINAEDGAGLFGRLPGKGFVPVHVELRLARGVHQDAPRRLLRRCCSSQ